MSTPTMNFALGLLKKFNSNTKAAQDAERRRKQEAAAAQARLRQEQQMQEKERLRREANKMVHRNASRLRPKPGLKRTSTKGSAGKPKEKKQMTPEQVALRMRGMAPDKEGKVRGRKVGGGSASVAGPPKPLPGMEFVVRRSRKKEIKVPHTSDYSDLFGDEYLVGIDVKCVRDMKEESAKATAEAKKILAERKRLAEELMKEAEESKRREAEAEKKGIKVDKNEWRRRAAEREYIAVDKPLNMMTPTERARVLRRAKGGAVDVGSASGGASASVGGGNGRTAGASGGVKSSGGVSKGRITKAEAKAASVREVAKRKAALKDRIMAATGGMSGKSTAGSRASSESPERRPVVGGKRKRAVEVEREGRRDSGARERMGRGRDSPKRWRREDREERARGYCSDEFSDEGEDESDGEELFGIEALEREEAESLRWAKREDKMERKRDLQHQREKEKRRLDFERARRRR